MVLILRVENGRSRFHFHCEWRRGETHPIHSNSIRFDSSDLLKDDLLMVNYLIRSGIYHMSRMTMFLEGGICNELRHSMSRWQVWQAWQAWQVWHLWQVKWQLNWQEGQYDDLYSCVIDTFVRRHKRRAWVLEGHGENDHMSSMYMSWVVMWHFGS